MAKPPPELLEFIYPYDAAIQSLALGVRKLVLEELAPCHEYVFAMRSKLVLLYGPTERVIKDNICAINLFPKHVNLGFHYGADLKDPRGILEGSGKSWRHIKLRGLAALDQPEIRACLRDARKRAGLKRPRQPTADNVVTRVKVPSRKKRLSSWPDLW